jgi:hypothetical protein
MSLYHIWFIDYNITVIAWFIYKMQCCLLNRLYFHKLQCSLLYRLYFHKLHISYQNCNSAYGLNRKLIFDLWCDSIIMYHANLKLKSLDKEVKYFPLQGTSTKKNILNIIIFIWGRSLQNFVRQDTALSWLPVPFTSCSVQTSSAILKAA